MLTSAAAGLGHPSAPQQGGSVGGPRGSSGPAWGGAQQNAGGPPVTDMADDQFANESRGDVVRPRLLASVSQGSLNSQVCP